MRLFWRGPLGGAVTFLLVTLLVAGGLGWATFHALRLEEAQQQAAAAMTHAEQVREALRRLDGRVAFALSLEDSRPYHHFSVLHVPVPALTNELRLWQGGAVWMPSPLLSAEMPDWMLLHFQAEENGVWQSPQVVSQQMADRLKQPPLRLSLSNVTPDRAALLRALSEQYTFAEMLTRLQAHGERTTEVEQAPPPTSPGQLAQGRGQWHPEPADPAAEQKQQEGRFLKGAGEQPAPPAGKTSPAEPAGGQPGTPPVPAAPAPPSQAPAPQAQAIFPNALPNSMANALDFQARGNTANRALRDRAAYQMNPPLEWDEQAKEKGLTGPLRIIKTGPMVPLWLPGPEKPERLVLARLVRLGERPIVQGVVLDWPKLDPLLREEVHDLFPDASLTPRPDGPPAQPERAMTALPLQLDPGPPLELPPVGWTWLRTGLALAWAAALIALAAVALVGGSLMDLSERRFRFVSAVTHELRTPLTTLRLYLDLLTSGLIHGEEQRADYLRTMHAESERLHRLIGNVLDYARLERGHPKLTVQPTPLDGLLERLTSAWRERCDGAGKELVIECGLPGETTMLTDPELVAQVVGNLIDNACKYSKEAADKRVWLRVRPVGAVVAFEVEDRGPGVRPCDRRSIFRPFARGRRAEETAGGVGLGLALAQRWANLLGGRLTVEAGDGGVGARFCLELPRQSG